MKMAVQSMACLGSFGPDTAALLRCAPLVAAHADGRAASADTSVLKEKVPARALRQMDHFSRMALLCMLRALEDATTASDSDLSGTGIILATGYGPASPTFAFLDSAIMHGEAMASPLAFSHSVHNIPAASLAMRLCLTGPCATFCQLDNPVSAGLMAAQEWLDEGRVARVIFGAVDEHTPLLARVSSRLAGRNKAPQGLRSALPISEGAVFFCLAPADVKPSHGWIERVTTQRPLRHACGEKAYGDNGGQAPHLLSGAVPRQLLTQPGALHMGHLYGNIPIAQAFDVLLALAGPQAPHVGKAVCHSFGTRGEVASVHTLRVSSPESAS